MKLGAASAVTVVTIGETSRAFMGQGDLLRERQPYAGSAGFGCVERYEEIAGIDEAGAVIEYSDDDFVAGDFPGNLDAP